MWKRVAVILLAICLGLMPLSVFAADPTVTITVSVWVVGAPSGLIATYISDYEVQLDWTKGLDAENTMIRGAYGREPTSRTDGFQVYYGDGITTMYWTNLETMSVPVYFKAYSETALGVWEEIGSNTDSVEGVAMIVIGLIVLSLALMAFAYKSQRAMVVFASAGSWLILAIVSYTKRGATFDVYSGLYILAAALAIVSALEPVIMREKKEPGVDDGLDDDDRALRAETEKFTAERTSMSSVYGRKRRRRPGLTHYERTGEH